jgi:uncharacterized protein (TIGR03118 family)
MADWELFGLADGLSFQADRLKISRKAAASNPEASKRRKDMVNSVGNFLSRSLLGAALAVAIAAPAAAQYEQTNLVSDIPGRAKVPDSHLVNPWGLVNPPGGPLWVSDNNAGVSTLYLGDGTIVPLVVTIPSPKGSTALATPTGIVWNGTQGFVVTEDTQSAPANFIFDTEDGTISAWSFTVDIAKAIREVDNSISGAVYKGLALGSTPKGTFLYATNFNSGMVEMYDSTFKLVSTFTDDDLPEGFAPFGIRNMNGNLYVTFALQNSMKHDDVPGSGNGFVDIFETTGRKIKRFASRGELNSPWGLALAPQDFGKFSGRLLVGNTGDGTINAFDPDSGEFRGTLRDGRPLTNDRLWALWFGDGVAAGAPNQLFFTAGIGDEHHGLLGVIKAEDD